MTHVNRKWSFFIFKRGFAQMFGQIVSITVKTLRNTNLAASRCFKMKETSFPVDVRRLRSVKHKRYSNLVPRVLSYPPYGARGRETRLSLSRSIGRVGENPGNEIDDIELLPKL